MQYVRITLLLIIAGALVLAGCGGDDGVSPAEVDRQLSEAAALAAAELKAAEEKAAADAKAAAEMKAAEEAAAAEKARMEAADAAAAALKKAADDAAAALKKAQDDATAALKKAEDDAAAALKKAEEEAAEKAAAAEKARMEAAAAAEAEKKAAEEKAAADLKAAQEKAAADLKAAEEKAAAELKAAEEKAAAAAAEAKKLAEAEEQRKMEEAAAAEKKAAEEKAAAEKKAAEEKAAAEKKAAEEAAAAEEQRMKDEEAARMKAAEDARMEEAAKAAKELMDVQMAAAAAMTAAKVASDAAAVDAMEAMEATASIATLQTGEMSKDMAMAAQMAADGAMKAYMAAKMASETAAKAETVAAATTARDMAMAEQAKAEKYAMTAMEKSDGAAKYAMMELMIDGTMKSVGGSSIDARMGTLTDTDDDGNKTITGLVPDETDMKYQPKRAIKDIPGSEFLEAATGVTGKAYKQAIKGGDIPIGKTLDTTDDMARLMLITDYRGSKSVRVFANEADPSSAVDGLLEAAVSAADGQALEADVTVTSIGTYYEATTAAGTPPSDAIADQLDYSDQVEVGAEGVEIFKLSGTDSSDASVMDHARIVRTVTTPGGTPVHYYRLVDIDAPAAPDDNAAAGGTGTGVIGREQIGVRADLPAAVDYDHLHFGVWASLGKAEKDGSQKLSDLVGIGFVQNISGMGVTDRQGIGTATFKGDWAAAIRRAHGGGEGAIKLANGDAELTANFGTDKFMGKLTGLATLTGSLSGNGFSGTKVTVLDNTHGLTAGADFDGMFEGNIYGPDGEEAGGVFDFMSESDGAFVGAFGGARDGK